ncbi:zinc ribbon domain-containing protein [Bacillus atrophaeus]|uniref:zinc ribbon domain-containing protein n=1 Tax=Bacillus atrophaeus TaxID=1452 RepID=UPI00228013C5|nr:zinc ribbon domain-containing protein [Bacillus atrophaeus]MCY8908168.1 zinc ribbon domain-containing protein [Bacillus atrophaeus]MEC0837943.1 zinc ribbon domain-containing protein [Bacillus atrophaeus]MEC0844181.1 zinc ribbon domain-containing protein [Bacillus atrophaeus]MEC0850561.1 zinc ribbon domain-containing protein [Bacillus atrophaeus]MEC0864303.1 zinc ribbon domain-containing protein [Bacillus atrophaeus]
MFFCKECGQKNNEGAKFCKECGTPIGGSSIQANKETASTVETRQAPRKPIPKKTIILWSSIAAACVILFAAYKTGAYLNSKDRLVDKFEQAVNNEDKDKIASLLTPVNDKLKLTKNNVKPFLAYLKDHPDKKNELFASLRDETAQKEIVYAEKDGKSLLVFDHYDLKIAPVYFEVTSNYKNTDLYVNKEDAGSVKKADQAQTLGPYIPGEYTVSAKLKNDVVDLVKKEEIQAVGDNSFHVDLSLEADDVTFSLADDIKDGKGELLINGKSIHKDPFKSVTYGPLLTDGSMTAAVEAEFPWGKTKTAGVPIDSKEMELTLIPDQDTQETIMNTIVKTTKQYSKALSDGNTAQMTEASASWKAEVKDNVDSMKNTDSYLKDKYLETDFDLDTFALSQKNDGTWQAAVTGKELHQSANYNDYTKPEMSDESPSYEYLLSYDIKQKKWIFEDAESTFDSAGTNIKKIKNDNAETYTSAWADSKGKKASVSPSTDDVTDEQVTSFMVDYLTNQSTAVNLNEFAVMEGNLEKGSSLYNDQQKLVKKLNSEGTTEVFIDVEVKSFSQSGSNITIKTYEEFDITKSGGSTKRRTYNWTYTGVVKDGRIYLTSIQ